MKFLQIKRLASLLLATVLLFSTVALLGCEQNEEPALTDATPDTTAEPDATVSPSENETTSAPTAPTAPESTPTDEELLSSQYLVVTDYIEADTGKDISAELQELIDDNRNRTIFFPDGEYVIGSPIKTSAHGAASVSLLLAEFAVIKASSKFPEGEPMFRLGAQNSTANNIQIPGSNYSFIGGVLYGNGRADGICIESGRETLVSDVSIKDTIVGIHIKRGVNSGSSDADIVDVNIVGTGKPNSIGVLCEGHDNTFTNMRIGKVYVGVKMAGGANMLRNIHPLYCDSPFNQTYLSSIGFWDVSGNNTYDFCYSDQFATGFKIGGGKTSVFDNCRAYWYTSSGNNQVFFATDGEFDSIVTNARVFFKADSAYNSVLDVGKVGGIGFFDILILSKNSVMHNNAYEDYLARPAVYY